LPVLSTLAVENYRSLRRLIVPLYQLNVVTGTNGTGKSSLYRALRLLADAARNGAVNALAREGGLPSTTWAGPDHTGAAGRRPAHPVQGTVRTGPVSVKLGFAGEDFGYALDLGLPAPAKTAFGLDPEIKAEAVWVGPVLRASGLIAIRGGPTARIRGADGSWRTATTSLRPFDSMLSELADPQSAPELIEQRDRIRSWRFYDHVRTDANAPARRAQIGTRTPVLSHDGADLAAALQTIAEIGDSDALQEAVDQAFPGSRIAIKSTEGRFELTLRQPGMLRPLAAAELSDGTLRYLLWVAALLTPRPPELLVLNEPESSLHPDLLAALGQLIVRASARCQIVAVTHAQPLVTALQKHGPSRDMPVHIVRLAKELGQTSIVGQRPLDEPLWYWPDRG
jgi:predicted ATPase